MCERHFSLSAVLILSPLLLCAAVGLAGQVGKTVFVVSAHDDKKLTGAELFAGSGCTHCHGADGTGTERGPSLRDVRKRLKPEQIADQIKNGGKEMPAFGESLAASQITDLVAFLDAKTWKTAAASASSTQ